jgi:hypothetical protein
MSAEALAAAELPHTLARVFFHAALPRRSTVDLTVRGRVAPLLDREELSR